ncbi:MAG: SPFH domain-containing protein [Eubacteriales bacterium]|nr:SPFH domain-containing protein [Eubacteriales bacterium]
MSINLLSQIFLANSLFQDLAKTLGAGSAIILIIILLLVILIRNIRVVPQANAYVIERLGTFKETWHTGLHVKMPFIDNIVKKLSLKEQVADFAPQAVITKDNVTMQIDTVVFYQVVDPKMYTYGIENPILAIENLSATTLRNIIGDLELDETLTSRDLINARMRETLDIATDPWGIKVNRVELKNIIPPREIQNAMERQMKAEREKRESILRAEGKKQAQITVAEGEKQAAILRAEAKKLQAIREAEGEAEAIISIQKATAQGLEMIKSVGVDNAVIRLRSLDALAKLGDGRATKLIIPSDIQNLANLVAAGQEIWQGVDADRQDASSDEDRQSEKYKDQMNDELVGRFLHKAEADPNGPQI